MATPYQWYADNRLAELRMLQGLASSAQTNGSPQVRALMEMMARNVFGAESLDSMALSDIQLMQYVLGVTIDNGMLPYVDDGAGSFESLYQMAKATGQFRGTDMQDRGALTYALHQRMQSAIYAPDGSTNYTFTGGLDGNMASQLYTELMRKEFASGRSRLSGMNVSLAQGPTYAARIQSMVRNAERLQSTGDMTSSELLRYQSAARSANRELGTETAVQYTLLKEGLEKNGIKLTEADEALRDRYGMAGLLQSENVLNQLAEMYNNVADRDAFNKRAVEEYATNRDDAVDIAVMRQAVIDSRQGKNTRVLGLDAIQDASVGEVLLGVGSGDLAVTRLGIAAKRDISRKDGEDIGAFVRRVLDEASNYNDGNGGGTTSDSLASVNRLANTYGALAGRVRERKGEDYVVTDEDIREEIAKAYSGKDGYENVERSFIEGVGNLEKILDEGKAQTEVLQQGTNQMDQSVKELFDRYGRTIRSLQDIFGTDNLKELQRNVDELHWGSLTNERDLQRISDNMDSVFGIAQVSGRSVQSVMLERKALTKALSAMSGGSSYVSDGEIAMMQTALQEIDRASQSGSGSISKEEAVAKMKRSVDNAVSADVFGGAAAVEELLESNRDMFSDKEAASLTSKVEAIKAVLANPDSTQGDRENAIYEARMLWYYMQENYGFSPEALRKAATKHAQEYGSLSPYNGLVNRFANRIEELGPEGDRVFSTDTQRTQARKAFATLMSVFGNADPGRYNEFKEAVSGNRLDAFLSGHSELAGYADQLREAAAIMQGMDTRQLGALTAGMQDQTGAIIAGGAARAQQRVASWEAFVQASTDTSIGVRTRQSDGFFGSFIRGLLNGDEAPITSEQALLNDMWDQVYGPDRARYNGGKNLEDRAKALEDVLATARGRERFGERAGVLGVYDKDKVVDDEAYARKLRDVGYTDEEVAAELEEFKKLRTAADRGLRMNETFAKKGYRTVIADGVVAVMNDASARAAAVKDERSWKEMSMLDFSEALKDDGVVSKDELLKVLGKENFDANDRYTGPLETLRGKSLNDLVDANRKGSFNYRNNDGDRSLAQLIDDKRNSNGAVDTIATEVGAITGQFKSIYDLLKDWRNDSRNRNATRDANAQISAGRSADINAGFGDTSWVSTEVGNRDYLTSSYSQGTAAIASQNGSVNLDDVVTTLRSIDGKIVNGYPVDQSRQTAGNPQVPPTPISTN